MVSSHLYIFCLYLLIYIYLYICVYIHIFIFINIFYIYIAIYLFIYTYFHKYVYESINQSINQYKINQSNHFEPLIKFKPTQHCAEAQRVRAAALLRSPSTEAWLRTDLFAHRYNCAEAWLRKDLVTHRPGSAPYIYICYQFLNSMLLLTYL